MYRIHALYSYRYRMQDIYEYTGLQSTVKISETLLIQVDYVII